MSSEEVIEKLEYIFNDIFGDNIPKLTLQTNADDIEEWDSLAHISILAAVQDEFGVTFDMDEIISMKNVGDMVISIQSKL